MAKMKPKSKVRPSAKKAASKAKRSQTVRPAAPAVARTSSSSRPLAAALAKASSTAPVAAAETQSGAMMMSVTQLAAMLVSLFIVNVAVVGVAAWLFPNQIVLGTYQLSWLMALLSSMGVLTLLLVGLVPLIEMGAYQAKVKLTDSHWIALYWVMNAVGLWLVARLADLLGLGLSSWLVAVMLAAVLDAIQGVVVTNFVSKLK